MGDLVVGFLRRSGDEAGGRCSRSADASGDGNELQEIQGDVFIAARTGAGCSELFHKPEILRGESECLQQAMLADRRLCMT